VVGATATLRNKMDEGRLAAARQDIVPAERATIYLQAIARRWWVVAGIAVVTAVLTFVMTSSKTKMYAASAKVLLTSAEPVNLLTHSTPAPSPDPERDLNTEIELVKLDSVARRVRAELKIPGTTTTAQILAGVSVTPEGTSNLVAIEDRDRSPEVAAAIANAFARQYVIVRRQVAQEAYATAAEQARAQLARLKPTTPEATALRDQLRQLQTAGRLQTGSAQVVDPAAASTKPVSPRPKFAAIVGAFGGLLIGALTAIGFGLLDRRNAAAAAAAAAASANGDTALSPRDIAAVEVLPGERAASLGTRPARVGTREP
jgi:tyrosine-protein kinase